MCDRTVRVSSKAVKQFHKTKMCKSFLAGECTKGETCKFAHCKEDLRSVPNLSKTKLCPEFKETGTCGAGSACSFAHGEEELRVTVGCYKTKMCRYFMEGACENGDACRYAHGEVELRRFQTPTSDCGGSTDAGTPGISCNQSEASEEKEEAPIADACAAPVLSLAPMMQMPATVQTNMPCLPAQPAMACPPAQPAMACPPAQPAMACPMVQPAVMQYCMVIPMEQYQVAQQMLGLPMVGEQQLRAVAPVQYED